MENEALLKNRLSELANRSYNRGIWVYSEFLTLAEQDVLLKSRLELPFTLFGGLPTSERKLACFGSEDLCGCEAAPPVVCLKLAPLQQKFADPLSHRDFLGALMSLGLRREVMGDIEIADNVGWLFCLESVAPFIADNLTSVRHTTVRAALSAPPEKLSAPPPLTELVVASERLDAAVAAVFRLSRSEAQALIDAQQVFISGRLPKSAALDIPPGAVVSVRRHGRFIYEGVARETKKGKLRILVRKYI